jgi:hypothetical protein
MCVPMKLVSPDHFDCTCTKPGELVVMHYVCLGCEYFFCFHDFRNGLWNRSDCMIFLPFQFNLRRNVHLHGSFCLGHYDIELTFRVVL